MLLNKSNSPYAFPKYLLASALALRIGLFAFSVWQDATRWPDGQLRFTDVDYDVFTDAAKSMVAGRDIYEARPTYRYSPLIAIILFPGHYVFSRFDLPVSFYPVAYAFGKVIFIACDIICSLLQRNIIMVENPNHPKSWQTISWLLGIFWLFNPITAAVSVRGNAESVLGVFVLYCLYSLLCNRIILAGLLFGTCIHLKLYPVIYAPAIYLYLCDPTKASIFRLPTLRHWCFGFATLASLLGLTGAGYWAYGWTFLHHAYFYHFTRVDFWHNFAPHFYPIYLFEGVLAINSTNPRDYYDPNLFPYNYIPEWVLDAFFQNATLEWMYKVFKILIMVPSVILIVMLSLRYWKKQSFAWFAITFIFVAFNKVSN
nr:Mannosyltransferase family protein [Hymenolepis microstoma]